MTDQLFQLPDDATWEVPDEITGSEKRKFAKARLYYPLGVDRFIKIDNGGVFTLPGVYYDKFDQETQTSKREGLKQFRGMKLNSKSKSVMALLVLEFADKNGKAFQRHLKMGLWKEKDDDGELRPQLWNEYQKAEIAKLTKGEKASLGKAAQNDTWVHIAYTEKETGYTFEYDPKTYVADIRVFKSEAEWQEANTAHFAQFDGSNGTQEASHYPWSDVPVMLEYANRVIEKFGKEDLGRLAVELQLVDNGKVAKTSNGEDCNISAILNEVLGTDSQPPPLQTKVDIDEVKKFSQSHKLEGAEA